MYLNLLPLYNLAILMAGRCEVSSSLSFYAYLLTDTRPTYLERLDREGGRAKGRARGGHTRGLRWGGTAKILKVDIYCCKLD